VADTDGLVERLTAIATQERGYGRLHYEVRKLVGEAASRITFLEAQLAEALALIVEIAADAPPEFVPDGTYDRGLVSRSYKAGCFDRWQSRARAILSTEGREG
jgi:hypothetical protein